MQRLHGLLYRDCPIKAMDLQQVDVTCAQALQTRVYGVEDGRPAQTALVDVVFALPDLFGVLDMRDGRFFADNAKAFGQQDQLLARDLVFLDGRADQLFGDAVGVDVGSVPSVEAAVVGAF